MNERLKIIATKLSKLFPSTRITNVSDVYTHLRTIAMKQEAYFSTIEPKDFLHLIFYIYSFLKTNNFDLANQMINNLVFAETFTTDLVDHSEECSTCDGRGEYTCDMCEGSGNEECSDCDGDGYQLCDECDGEGKVTDDEGETVECDNCDGKGRFDCDYCDGDGVMTCGECGGDGRVNCSECDGDGDIEDGTTDYTAFFLCTWNKDFQDLLEVRVNTEESIPYDYYDNNFANETLILKEYDSSIDFNSLVDSNEIYVIEVIEDPLLEYSGKFTVDETNSFSDRKMVRFMG